MTKITYNGKTTELADGYIATLPCKDLKMETDVVVEAPEGSGGVNAELQEKSVTITENGTTEVFPDAGKALSKVTITTKVHQNFCAVRFYNDDRTTLLYEIVVPYGSSAVYAGEAPTSSLGADYTFTGFEPSTANVTADTDCYAVYEAPPIIPDMPEITTLEAASWADISAVSATGTAANYFAIGDTKAVTLNGAVGEGCTLSNKTYYVYIIGFDHNSAKEGNGITFGTFKTAASGGKDICLADGASSSSAGTAKHFDFNHKANSNHGGWAGSDLRYDILGSTNVAPSEYNLATKTAASVGYDATETCATNPVPNTLMAALPADLRAVMKPMTIYTDNTGNGSMTAEDVTATIDYLPLLAAREVVATCAYGNAEEQNHQQQYAYYAAGNSIAKYDHSAQTTEKVWWTRSCTSSMPFVCINSKNGAFTNSASYVLGLSPIFRV